MKPYEAYQTIRDIDGETLILDENAARLSPERDRAVIDGDTALVHLIDHGPRRGEGRPNGPAFVGFDQRLPGLIGTRQRLADLRERRALIETCLPSVEARQDAERQATALAADLATRGGEMTEALSALATAMETAERAAAALVDARRAARNVRGVLAELIRDYGLTVSASEMPVLPRERVETVRLIAIFIEQASDGEPDSTVMRELASARARATNSAVA